MIESYEAGFEDGRRQANHDAARGLFNEVVLLLDASQLGSNAVGVLGNWISDLRRERTGPPKYKKDPIPPSLRKQVHERDAYRCQRCKGWEDLTVDHVTPESAGGETKLSNLQTLCRVCNCRKGVSV